MDGESTATPSAEGAFPLPTEEGQHQPSQAVHRQDNSGPSNANPRSDRKRKRPQNKSNHMLEQIYAPIASSGRPGTPQCFFKESYEVVLGHTMDASESLSSSSLRTAAGHQVGHRHANGLVIVTAGSVLTEAMKGTQMPQPTVPATAAAAAHSNDPGLEHPPRNRNGQALRIKAIHFQQEVAAVAHESAAKKRKQQSKLLKSSARNDDNDTPPGLVKPQDVLAQVELERVVQDCPNADDATTSPTNVFVDLYCSVWGSVLEINPS